MSDVKLTTVTVDGLSVQTTDAGAQAISKLTKDLETVRKASSDAESEHTRQLAAKDGELATKDAELEKLKGKILSDADLDQLVTDRADLIATAKSIADVDYTGQSAEAIRALAVSSKLGKDAIAGKSNDYITARFDILAEDATQDPVRKVMRDGTVKPQVDTADASHAAMVDRLTNGWKNAEASQ